MHSSQLPDDYLPLLDEINRIVVASGKPLEGNLFYTHNEQNPARNNVNGHGLPKRCNFVAVCKAATRMIEIGFNAGHSALLALSCGIEVHSVDICRHPYTQPAADFLKSRFGDRFHFYAGDSMKVLPDIRVRYPNLYFDLLHIDGHHGLNFCRADTFNAIMMATHDAWILLDDINMKAIGQFWLDQVADGMVKEIKPEGWKDGASHAVGKVIK